jgi:hypothetical protein
VGYEPTGSLGDLVVAAEERLRTEWDRTAGILANQTNLKAGKVVVKANDINPYRATESKLPTMSDMAGLLDP